MRCRCVARECSKSRFDHFTKMQMGKEESRCVPLCNFGGKRSIDVIILHLSLCSVGIIFGRTSPFISFVLCAKKMTNDDLILFSTVLFDLIFCISLYIIMKYIVRIHLVIRVRLRLYYHRELSIHNDINNHTWS